MFLQTSPDGRNVPRDQAAVERPVQYRPPDPVDHEQVGYQGHSLGPAYQNPQFGVANEPPVVNEHPGYPSDLYPNQDVQRNYAGYPTSQEQPPPATRRQNSARPPRSRRQMHSNSEDTNGSADVTVGSLSDGTKAVTPSIPPTAPQQETASQGDTDIAKTFEKCKSVLDDLESTKASTLVQLQGETAHREDLEKKNRQLIRQIRNRREEKAKIEGQVQQSEERLAVLASMLSTCSVRATTIEDFSKEVQSQLNDGQREAEELKSLIARLAERTEDLSKSAEAASTEREKLVETSLKKEKEFLQKIEVAEQEKQHFKSFKDNQHSEMKLLNEKLGEMNDKNNCLTNAANDLELSRAHLKNDNTQLKEQLDKTNTQIIDFRRTIEEQAEQILAHGKETSRAALATKEVTDKLRAGQELLKERASKITDLANQQNELLKEVESVRAEKLHEMTIARATNEGLRAENEAALKDLGQLRKSVTARDTDIIGLQKSLADLTSEVKLLQRAKAALEKSLVDRDENIRNSTKKIDTLESSSEKAELLHKRIAELEAEVLELGRQSERKDQALEARGAALKAVEDCLEEKESRLLAGDEKIREGKDTIRDLERKLEVAKNVPVGSANTPAKESVKPRAVQAARRPPPVRPPPAQRPAHTRKPTKRTAKQDPQDDWFQDDSM